MNASIAAASNERAQPRLALRLIGPEDHEGLAAIEALHMELLDYGPMAQLGGEFVREVCYRAHMREGVLRVLLAEVDGAPAGFIATTAYSAEFHRQGLSAHFALAAWQTAKAIVRRPKRLPGLLRALRVLGSRRAERTRGVGAPGEVVCIAVRSQYLAPRFQRSTGLRLSDRLVRESAAYLRRAGVESMRMLVDADNRPVLMLYHLLGARFRDYSLGGEPMVEVVFDLRDGKLAPPAVAPAAWTEDARNAASGNDWSAYWEGIKDEQEVFRAEARDHIERVLRFVRPAPDARVLDFGCGFGFAAERLAPHVGAVHLWDASGSVRRRARIRTAHLPNVALADLSDPDGAPPPERFDLVNVHSVLQYMSEEEIARWLVRWRGLLAPGGRIVLSDLIQPGSSPAAELAGYLAFSARAGFLFDALLGGLREFARYFGARSSRPLTPVPAESLESWAARAGLEVEWLPGNTSYRRFRRAAVLRVR